jgi:hypothetical protein
VGLGLAVGLAMELGLAVGLGGGGCGRAGLSAGNSTWCLVLVVGGPGWMEWFVIVI